MVGAGAAAALVESEVKNLRDRRLAFTISSSAGGPNGRMEMCTIVPVAEVATSGNLAAVNQQHQSSKYNSNNHDADVPASVWSSDKIFPICSTLKNDGAGGFSATFSTAMNN